VSTEDSTNLEQQNESPTDTAAATDTVTAEVPAIETAHGANQVSSEDLARLEDEGEIAADYLEELLDIIDFDGDIDLDVTHGRASAAIIAEGGNGKELQKLVGQDGEVLDALQDLTRLAVQTKSGDRSRLMLDIAGFRAQKRAHLVNIAREAVAKVHSSGAEVRMDPMNAFERKVVHDEVASAGLVSNSVGEDPDRRVVISPASE